ncbi:MAG: phage shock protein A [Cyanobacteria bacterium QH_8_48_120]|jgi:phage shock protein A|nr:MAG: phage shock protein A [Cyanobacteria bacterium QH_10_48_56]PSO57743.1 MAG: phage shock protein A [Cyanobacteria bacterium QH_1_48_107]PSO61994.1 MAG: phage shock protein A [Cyanobacteria bacterium QH_2_48_84]PSO62073.1 MAG: phage shock protein A [Cyanobacteria bacterium QH_6_48_35]PSO62643.1 MAG: phage shock protein A [Cyanobacteria bacterium QH_7_48_89]PSO68962.1 MAG: phage shock protein A [Cyanobacteria bacterium QH_8_48_120]PSO72606.1 MAG: phage shock protein A [Cyanobacteria bacte
MGLLERVWRVIRSNISSLVGKAEDPEKVLEQAVADMQQDLIKMRQAVAQAIASQKRTERQATQAQSTADEWRRRAQLALNKGDEDLAREALTRRQSYQETAQTLQNQLEQQNGVIDKMKKDMRTLENKISDAKTKKDMYIARARSAEASQKINEQIGNTGTESSMSAFERMEERVMELEASSEATQELATDDIENRFSALEGGDNVDEELASLKSSQGSSTNQEKLPSSDNKDSEEIDRELDKLRSEKDNA